jgi:hypothetical protein
MSDIDITFDFRSDAGTFRGSDRRRDPDKYSPTLRKYHQLLWSKPLPSGRRFDLVDTTPGVYLHHHSDIGEFKLSSDAVVPSFRKHKSLADTIEARPPGRFERFMHLGYTIGGMMVFPENKVDGKMTINGARGCHPRLKDRFDLTVECIRRHYEGEDSPLGDTFARYGDFFALFESFKGYVDFFLLQDIVSSDYRSVSYHAPFSGFEESPVPQTAAAYERYLDVSEAFIHARNRRILASRQTPAAVRS